MSADRLSRWLKVIVGGLAITAAALVVYAVISWNGLFSGDGFQPNCDSYSFERSEWASGGIDDDSREHQAEALAECDALVGKTRADVTAMLGSRDTRASTSTPRKWWFSAGWVNDGIGVGDGQILYVYFDESGHVERAKLAYPQ